MTTESSEKKKFEKKLAIQPATLTNFQVQPGNTKPPCALPFSILQPYHKGEKLDSLIRAVNLNFSYCKKIEGDTLQRHNFILEGKTPEEAYDKSLKEGNTWRDETKESRASLTIPHDDSNWNESLFGQKEVKYTEFQIVENLLTKIESLKLNEHTLKLSNEEFLKKAHELIEKETSNEAIRGYLKKRIIIQQAYENAPKFQEKVEKAVLAFLQKDKASTANLNIEKKFKIAKEYILEELAVFLLWNEQIDNEFKEKLKGTYEGKFYFVYPLKCSEISKILAEAFAEIPEIKNGKRHLYFQDAVPPGYKTQGKRSPSPPKEKEKDITTQPTSPSSNNLGNIIDNTNIQTESNIKIENLNQKPLTHITEDTKKVIIQEQTIPTPSLPVPQNFSYANQKTSPTLFKPPVPIPLSTLQINFWFATFSSPTPIDPAQIAICLAGIEAFEASKKQPMNFVSQATTPHQ